MKNTLYLNQLTYFTGFRPQRLVWTSSNGDCAENWDLGKGSLCILPCKQCVHERTEVHLLEPKQWDLGNKVLSTWSLGWPSCMCQRDN